MVVTEADDGCGDVVDAGHELVTSVGLRGVDEEDALVWETGQELLCLGSRFSS